MSTDADHSLTNLACVRRIREQVLVKFLAQRRKAYRQQLEQVKNAQKPRELLSNDARLLMVNSESWKNIIGKDAFKKESARPFFVLYSKITAEDIAELIQQGLSLSNENKT